MKRFVKQMAAFVMMVFAVACVKIDDIELSKPANALGSDSGVVTISPRISHYTDCDVSTRSAKEGDEAKVTSMAMALFPISDEGEIQPCLYYQYNGDGNMLFVLDRNKAPFTESDDRERYLDDKFVMYIIANMQESGIPQSSGYVTEEGKIAVYQSDGSVQEGEPKDMHMKCGAGWTISQFIEKAHTIKNNECFEKIHKNGLPMLGMLGDTFNQYGDGNIFIFHPTKGEGNTNGLPMIDSTPKDGVDNFIPTDNLEIPMRSLYAKFSFTIGVDSNQEIVGNASPRFDLIGYKVVNAPGTVYLSREMNEDNNVINYEGDIDYNDVVSSEFHNVAIEGLYAQGATKATFTFYVPERTLEPENSPDEYTYYLGENGAGIKGYDNIPKDMQKYAQRFKPELVGEGQKATHVEVKGTFTDHQSHVYDVTYKIYLGKDNYGDFNIIRNTHYNNFITIKGIDNFQDAAINPDGDSPSPISIDHRVSIERTTPLVIGLRRETQLDAHFEVRPLRLHLSGGTDPSKTVKVSLRKANETDPELNTWIGMEWKDAADAGDQTYCTSGKRKYFTTDLVGSLGGAKSITIDNLSETEYSTIWIYVDENLSTSNRSAILSTSYTYGGVTFTDDYVITQHGLYKVTNGDRTYYIENFEEYLYNYDIEDVYGQTKDEGMPWGLEGVQLSNEHQSFTINEDNQTWKDYIAKNPTIVTYDFYTWEQDSLVMKNAGIIDKQNDKRWHEYAGQHFTGDIYKKSNGEVRYLAMDQLAKGAVEYCYSKNKKNTNGSVDVKWYLPSAGELEDFIVAAYSSFEEFQDNYYWTSQPAYTRNAFYYEFKKSSGFLGLGSTTVDTYAFIVYEDNTDYARATKVKSLGNDKYGYASSGLNDEPKERGTFNNAVYDSGTPTDILGYFKTWYQWKKPAIGSATTTPVFTDQWYWDMKDEKPTERLYYAFVNENYFNPEYNFGMLQEGYQLRTKKNRVRCAYKSN